MSTFTSLSSSIVARQIARVSRPRPWVVPALIVKPAPVVCSTTVPSSTFSSLPKSTIARVAARVCRSPKLSTISSSSSKRSIVGGRQPPVAESGLRQTTLAARASARASRDRPWLNSRPASIAAKVSKSNCKTAQWIKSQAVDLRQALRRPHQASPPSSSTPVRHSSTSDTSTSIPAPPIVIPKRSAAATGHHQAVRSSSTSNNRAAVTSSAPILSSPSHPQQVVSPASPDNSIAAIVREAFAFDINEFRAEMKPLYEKIESHRKFLQRLNWKPVTSDDTSSHSQQVVSPASPDNSIAAIVREAFAFDINEFRAEMKPLYEKIESHRKFLRRLNRKPVTFDDNPTVIEHPRWIKKQEHVHSGPPRMMGYILGWQAFSDTNTYQHTIIWGSDSSNFDHSDCPNPDCHRRAKDLYMQDYEEWTPPTFTTMSE